MSPPAQDDVNKNEKSPDSPTKFLFEELARKRNNSIEKQVESFKWPLIKADADLSTEDWPSAEPSVVPEMDLFKTKGDVDNFVSASASMFSPPENAQTVSGDASFAPFGDISDKLQKIDLNKGAYAYMVLGEKN